MSDFFIGICVILFVASAVSNLTVFYKYAMEIYEEYKNTVNTDKPTDLPPEPIQKTEQTDEDLNDVVSRVVAVNISKLSDQALLAIYSSKFVRCGSEQELGDRYPELYNEMVFRGLILNKYERGAL